jgi:hypothetical protein
MITIHVFGPGHEFEFFSTVGLTLQHYPWLVILGVLLGTLASLFNRYLIAIIAYFRNFHIFTRVVLAGVITGILGYAVPFAMGTDMSAITFSLEHNWQWQLLLGLLAVKFLMTIFAIGLGVPGGIIGPILGIGAIAGTCTAMAVMSWLPGESLSSDFALMGMAGFMAATLNAPLTALLAVVELSNQVEVIVPAMLVITIASLTSGQLLSNRSIFTMQLDIQGLSYRKPPFEAALQNIGVLGYLSTDFTLLAADDFDSSDARLGPQNTKLVVLKTAQPGAGYDYALIEYDNNQAVLDEQEKLLPLSSQATLAEVYALLQEQAKGAVYIYDEHPDAIIGIITFAQIQRYLAEGSSS